MQTRVGLSLYGAAADAIRCIGCFTNPMDASRAYQALA